MSQDIAALIALLLIFTEEIPKNSELSKLTTKKD